MSCAAGSADTWTGESLHSTWPVLSIAGELKGDMSSVSGKFFSCNRVAPDSEDTATSAATSGVDLSLEKDTVLQPLISSSPYSSSTSE